MCGIAGIISFKKDELRHITSMLNAFKHRGPDDEGYVFLKKEEEICYGGEDTPSDVFGLGPGYSPRGSFSDVPDGSFGVLAHRRLSIIDLSPYAHQPMCSKDKNLWIIFNGEVYNYIELREELEALECTFSTNTDTEVVLNAYKVWGQDCVKKFNGMWSFVIYDKSKNILFGSRDRFGVKPFYYYIDKYQFAFASEIKSLSILPFINKKINPGAVFDYLAFGCQENEEEGFFQGIFELPPSFSFEYNFSDRSFKKWKYYNLDYTKKWKKFSSKKLEEYSRKTRSLIIDAVRLRLRSDVPVGSCLSGGIDSSTIVCIISGLLNQEALPQIGEKQKTFTACYDSKDIDESRWAELAAKTADTLWFKTFPKPEEFLKDLEDLIYTQDIPFLSTSIYAQYMVMKLAKENNVKVLLDGQGADELFTGYSAYYGTFFNEILKNLDIASFLREFNSLSNSSIDKSIALKSVMKHILSLKDSKPKVYKNMYFDNGFEKENLKRLRLHREKKQISLNKMLFESQTEGHLKNLLRYEDRNSMRFSIEARTPFADDINLIEYVSTVPSSYKIHNGFSKYLLREAVKDIIPAKIRKRTDKIGFATPEYDWLHFMKEDLKSYITRDLDPFINTSSILNNWDKILKHNSSYMWRLINFAVWKKVYCL
ncbi:MAG: asparagine synthase (glutamine-hydrolyzing) [Armatimonadota bacterium]